MKKSILTILLTSALIALHAQQIEINFDDGYLDWIKIDSINPNNSWQIGPPQKTLFDSAFSAPNVIITDTSNYYSIKDTSAFYVYFTWHSPSMWPELGFKFKINSDSISDFGNIEASYDNGNTWIEVIKDAEQYDIEWFVYGQDLGGGNFEIIHGVGIDTIAFTGSSDIWYTFYMSMYGWDSYFPYNDTIIYRISFQSDSIQTNKEGWMIDNIWINDWVSSLDENDQNRPEILAYPNPFTDHLSFKTPYKNRTLECIKIYDINGNLIKNVLSKTPEIILNMSDLKAGSYFYYITDNLGDVYNGKLTKD